MTFEEWFAASATPDSMKHDLFDCWFQALVSRDAEVAKLRQQLAANDLNEPKVDHAEYKTWWELALHVGAWKDHDLDYVHFGSEAAVRAYAILLLRQRDAYELKQFNTIEALRQQVTLLREPLLYIDEVAKTSKTIISVAAAAMKMLKKIRAALTATDQHGRV